MHYLIHKFWLLCLLAISLLPHYALAQDVNDLKVALSYNFAKFTQWPQDMQATASWQLCYIGEQYRASFQLLNDKKLADSVIKTNELKSLTDINQCHIFYIGAENRKLLPRLFIALNNQPILTISDMPGFTEMGGMIEIVPADNRLQFKVNLSQMEQAQLNISSQVLKLAIEVKR